MSDPITRPADLSLYMFEGCAYCARVRRVLGALGVEVELRDINRVAQHREDLVAARGRQTVPVLRIGRDDGPDEWLPESLDINQYLAERFGDGTVPAPKVSDYLTDWRVWVFAVGIGWAMVSALGWV